MERNILIILFFAAAFVWNLAVFAVAPRVRLVKLNFAKKPIMASYGIAAFPWMAAIIGSLVLFGYANWTDARLYLWVMTAMWVLGTCDDIFGSRDVGGFKGHFKKLLFERKLTTGAAKAIGGGIVGLVAGWSISGGDILRFALAAMVIPLATNTLNLLDLRPGRAVAVFFLGIGVTCIATLGRVPAPLLLAAICAVTTVFGIVDSRGRAMMGDSGSNAIGAALGVTLALTGSIAIQIGAIAVFVAITIYSEKRSVSALIEQNRILRFIDRRLGVR